PGEIQPRIWKARAGIIGRSAGPVVALRLAGKRARTAEYAGTRGDSGGWLVHSSGGVAIGDVQTGCGALAGGNACGKFQLGRFTGRSHRASREPRGKGFAREHHARVQVEQEAGSRKAGRFTEDAAGEVAERRI